MTNRILITAALLSACLCNISYGQESYTDASCSHVKTTAHNPKNAAKTTVAHPEEDKYDVTYVKLDLEMSNVTTAITGNVTTIARVTSPTLAGYVFELLPPLVIDSVHIDGVLHTATTTSDTCTVLFASPRTAGTMFTARVFYHGTPVSGSPSNIYGISTLQSPSWDNWVTFTLSEPYSAENWWPCKQSLRDKIDSADIWITVEDSLKAGSNGTLTAVTPMGGGRNRYEWKERYPIDYYLISASVGRYIDYSYYVHFPGSADSMLIQNYVYDNPGALPAYKSVIDSIGHLVNYFGSIYGRYPFWKEKYGHCMAPLNGGEEHQTMTTLGYFQSWLVAHEMGHQWFGDNVTCGTWTDIAMNEGFASYSEILYYEHFQSHARAIDEISEWQVDVMSEPDGAVYVDDTTSEARIFSRRLTYQKAACAIHTLRHVIDNDTYFFDLLHGWQELMKDSTGTIEDFKNLAITLLSPERGGISFDTFFNQWFYGQGFPAYTARWSQYLDDVTVWVDQATTAPSSVSCFKVPLEIKLRYSTGDTVIRVVNDQPSQTYHFKLNKLMTGVELDPNNWLTDSVTSITRIAVLGAVDITGTRATISPNPSSATWMAAGLDANSTLTLTDVTGKILWQAANGTRASIDIPAQQLSAGLYLLRISNDTKGEAIYKLVKE